MSAIALFPGSFKPPHAAHLHAVRHLLEQDSISKIVIIISNRCRLIPGTDYALDAEAACGLFKTMLHYANLPMKRICVEIAEHRAITHALDFFEKVDTQDSLVFCIGPADFETTDDRFACVPELSRRTGVSARIEVLPRAPIDVHASELRRCIAAGYVSRKKFIASLPAELSEIQQIAIWTQCLNSLRPVSDIVRAKIYRVLAGRYDLSPDDLHEVTAQSVDPVFRIRRNSRENLIVKYAGDTTVRGMFGDDMTPQPARRLAVERRALKHLAAHLDQTFARPAVDFFDKRSRTSVLTGPPNRATTIDAELRAGTFDVGIAAAAARLLAELHQCPLPQDPFWGSRVAEQNHWHKLVDTLGRHSDHELRELHQSELAQDLFLLSRSERVECVLHLDFVPKNLWHHDGHVGVENFERSGSYGDPAYDLATFIARYIQAGLRHGLPASCMDAVDTFVSTYLQQRSVTDKRLHARLLVYIAYHLLAAPTGQNDACPQKNHARFAIAILVEPGLDSVSALPSSTSGVLRDRLQGFVCNA